MKLYCFYLPISLFVCRLPCPTHDSIFSLFSGTMLPIVCSLKFCRIFKGRLLQYNETHMTFQPLKFEEGTFYMCSLCCHFKPSSTLTILLLLACTCCCFVPVAMKRETCVCVCSFNTQDASSKSMRTGDRNRSGYIYNWISYHLCNRNVINLH